MEMEVKVVTQKDKNEGACLFQEQTRGSYDQEDKGRCEIRDRGFCRDITNDEMSFLFLFAFPFLLLFHFASFSLCAACLLSLLMHTRDTKGGAQIPDICAQCALVTCVSVLVTYVSVLVTNTIIPDHHVRLLTQKMRLIKKVHVITKQTPEMDCFRRADFSGGSIVLQK